MKKYEAQRESDRLMLVIEKPTGNVMYAGAPQSARPFANKLNGGCGFNGLTPEFMFHRFIVSAAQREQNIFIEGKINV